MVLAVNGQIAKQTRRLINNKGNDELLWRSDFITPAQDAHQPQAFLVEMMAHGNVLPHFHQVDQFQLLIDGAGTLGRSAVPLLALHYVDRHTAYGPLRATECGLSFFTIRAGTDPGVSVVYLHNPDYKQFLKPGKQRYLLAAGIALSTAPVLQSLSSVALENLLPEADADDGLGALMLRMGADMHTTGPDPARTAGQYFVVVNGSLRFNGASFPAWSMIYAAPNDAPLTLTAESMGLEVILLSFPRPQT